MVERAVTSRLEARKIMSRRFPKADETKTETQSIPGGADGMIPDASSTIHFAGATENAPAPQPDPEEAVKLRRFRVCTGGPNKDGSWPLLLDSVRVDMKPGKVFDEGAYDIERVMSQGVKLEEL
jgi:hypothetical protein